MKNGNNAYFMTVIIGVFVTAGILLAGWFDSPQGNSYSFEDSACRTETLKAEDSKTDLNSASAEELTVLYGIGSVRAQAIVDYRNSNGGFMSVDELTSVSGISDKIFEANTDKITVGPYTEGIYGNQSY